MVFSVTAADTLTAKVVGVTDGDTIKVLTADKKQLRIRLYGIDTPESSQSYGAKAKKHLSSLVFNKSVSLTIMNTDRYGRKVCKVFIGKTYVNLAMVEAGYAWHYKKYAPKDNDLAKAEKTAKTTGKELWADKNPTPPWEFRRSKVKKNADSSSKTAVVGYWLNTSSNIRHNSDCRYFEKTKQGRASKKDEGRACGLCGG
jgi:endonuclease YncB( thermonuclease family)